MTTHFLNNCPVDYEIILSRKFGLGHARNWGARQAKNDLLVFLDDDLTLLPKIWKKILEIKHGEFSMTFLGGFPCTRVMSIHQIDFWAIGGFDEEILYTGEDRDFYVRALDNGLRFKEIPINLMVHNDHLARSKNIHIAIHMVRENMIFLVKYGGKHRNVFKVDFFYRLLHGQFRTLLLEVVMLPFIIFGRLRKK